MVIVLSANTALTPAGKPTGVPIPFAPVVVCVMDVINVFIQSVGDDDAAATVLIGVIIIVKLLVSEQPEPFVSIKRRIQLPSVVHVIFVILSVGLAILPLPNGIGTRGLTIIAQE